MFVLELKASSFDITKIEDYRPSNGVVLNQVDFSVDTSSVLFIGGSNSNANFVLKGSTKFLNQGNVYVSNNMFMDNDNVILDAVNHNFVKNRLTENKKSGKIIFKNSNSITTSLPHLFVWNGSKNNKNKLSIDILELDSKRGMALVDSSRKKDLQQYSTLYIEDSLILKKGILHSFTNIVLGSKSDKYQSSDMTGNALDAEKEYKYIIGNNITGNFNKETFIYLHSERNYVVKVINPYVASSLISDSEREKLLDFIIPLGDTAKSEASYSPIRMMYTPNPLDFIGTGASRKVDFDKYDYISTGKSDVHSQATKNNRAYDFGVTKANYSLDSATPHIAFRVTPQLASMLGKDSEYNGKIKNYVDRNYIIRDHLLGQNFNFKLDLNFVEKDTSLTTPLLKDKSKFNDFFVVAFHNDGLNPDLELLIPEEDLKEGNITNNNSKISIDYSNKFLRPSLLTNSKNMPSNNIGVISIFENMFDEIELELSALLYGMLDSNSDSLMVSFYEDYYNQTKTSGNPKKILPIQNPFHYESEEFPEYYTKDASTFKYATKFDANNNLSVKVDTLVYEYDKGNKEKITDYVYVELLDSVSKEALCGEVGLITTKGKVIDINYQKDNNGTIEYKNLMIPCSPLKSYLVKINHLNHFPVTSSKKIRFNNNDKKGKWDFRKGKIEDVAFLPPKVSINPDTVLVKPMLKYRGSETGTYDFNVLISGNLNNDRYFSRITSSSPNLINYESDYNSMLRFILNKTNNKLELLDAAEKRDYYGPYDVSINSTVRLYKYSNPNMAFPDYLYLNYIRKDISDQNLGATEDNDVYEINTIY